MQFSAIRALLKHAGHSSSHGNATGSAVVHVAAGGAPSYSRLLGDVPVTVPTTGGPASANEVVAVPRGVPSYASSGDLSRAAFEHMMFGQGGSLRVGGISGRRLSQLLAQAPPYGSSTPLCELNAARLQATGAAALSGAPGPAKALALPHPLAGSSGSGRRKHQRTGRNRFPRHFRLGGYGMGLCGAFLVEAFGNTTTANCFGAEGGEDGRRVPFSTGGSSSGFDNPQGLASPLFALFRMGNDVSSAGGGGGGGGSNGARPGSAASYGGEQDGNNNNRTPARPPNPNSNPRPIQPPMSPAARAAEAASIGLERVFHDNRELGTQVTLGGVAGFCSGYAVKKVSKVAAFVVGVGFIGVQVARYYGVINDIDWSAVEGQIVRRLDTDGDGKITHVDLKAHFDRGMEVLGFNLPSGAAFATFFLMGLRYG